MKIPRRKRKKKIIGIVLCIMVCASVAIGALVLYGKARMAKIPGMTFLDTLEYTTNKNKDVVITVGTIKDGEVSYTVYGENARILPKELHTYEIGSITKTMTASLVSQAISDGLITLDETIDAYLPLPEGKSYPTVQELLAHTSGYSAYYWEAPMIKNFLTGKNSFCGITGDMVLQKAKSLNMSRESYRFTYSNFGYALLGLVLEAVYKTTYMDLVNDYVQNTLGMEQTKIVDGSGDLGKYWDWEDNDAYLSTGGLTSNMEDMLRYAKLQLDDPSMFARCHESLKNIDASPKSYRAMGINMDEIGMAWIIDRENGIIWHNGGTGHYNSYLGFNPDKGTAVVVLSNLPPGERIPATVLGVKLLTEL